MVIDSTIRSENVLCIIAKVSRNDRLRHSLLASFCQPMKSAAPVTQTE